MTEKVYVQTFFYVWFMIIIGSLIFYFSLNFDYAIAYFLGAVTSVMLMSHNYKTTMKTARIDPSQLKVRTIKNYVFRYFFYTMIAVFIYLQNENIYHIFPLFLGYATFKIVMMINFFVQRKGVERE
ncbi:MAG: ATP synthase subunit I [Bacillota bacterium]